MNEGSKPSEPSRPGRSQEQLGSRVLLVLAGALLFAEYLLVTYLFDARSVAIRGGAWTWIANVGQLGPPLMTTATAWFALFRLGPRGSALPRAVAGPARVSRRPWLAAHACCASAFLALNSWVFHTPPVAAPSPAWILAWVALALGTGTTSLLGVLGGTRWLRVMARDSLATLPLGLALWQAGILATQSWPRGSSWVLGTLASVLSALGAQTSVHPELPVVFLDGWAMRVWPNCSGYEGLGLLPVLTGAYVLVFRESLPWPRAIGMVPLSFAMAWLLNLPRFVALSLIGNRFGSGVAVALFHSTASWLAYCAAALAFVGILRSTLRWPRAPIRTIT